MERLTGCTRATMLALDHDGVLPACDGWVARMRLAIAEDGWAGDVTFRPEGERRIAETTIMAVHGTSGEVVGAIAVCRDVTDVRDHAAALADAERQAHYDARHDALTGLPNRKLLTDHFDKLMNSPAAAEGAALLMIDLDRFKDVNDTLGHDCGDELLIQVGRVLEDVVRGGDLVVRLGGDEFVVLVAGLARIDAAMGLADRVRVALEQPFRVQGIDLDVEASIGVTTASPGQDIATVLRQADVAMYIAKRRGAGAFAYDAATDVNSEARLSLLGELRGALNRHDLVLHYQPKISLTTGDVVGAEALVRWNHQTRGLIPPDEFIPMAEHTGLIRLLTRYVLDAAIAEERRWMDEGRPLPIAVNLSARNLMEDRLAEQIIDLLRRHGVPPELLEVEITESCLVTEPVRARVLLARLRALGIRVSVDDFGTGYTSLAILKNLSISELKIDRSFIEAMTAKPGTPSSCKALSSWATTWASSQ
jgi:diguanylate cyclase (GGDEF)-like protein